MKKFLSIFIICFFMFIGSSVRALELKSSNVVMYQLNEDKAVYKLNSDEMVSIASMTKIMTTIVAIENISDVNESLIITNDMFTGLYEQGASLAGFYVGQQVTYLDLLYGAMLPSGAEATRALALTISGSEEAYVELMNQKATELGLSNTHFENTTGLDEYGHYSTVDDVAHIFMYALENPLFKEIISKRTYTTSDGNLTFSSTIKRYTSNYDIELPYLIGGKTGFTLDAGYCLASVAEVDGITYVVVSSGAPTDSGYPYHVSDAKTLYDFFFENYGYQTVSKKGEVLKEIPVKYGNVDTVTVKLPKDVVYYMENDYHDNVSVEINLVDEISYDAEQGDVLGTYSIYYQGELLDIVYLNLENDMKFSLWKFIQVNFVMCSFIFCVVILIIVSIICIKRRKKNGN